MTMILNEAEVKELLDMRDCIEAVEDAYRELAFDRAFNIPRGRMRYPSNLEGNDYFFNCIPGSVLKFNFAGIRIDSVTRVRSSEDLKRSHAGTPIDNKFCGLILLFSISTGELAAILPDFTISGVRVGATSAIALKYLARKDAKRMALFGSGKQARTHAEAICRTLPIEEIRVFSPNREHRVAFAAEMTEKSDAEIIPVDHPRKAVEDADIIVGTSNSNRPVFEGEWLREGATVVTITGGDRHANQARGFKRREIDETTVLRSNRIVVNSREQVMIDEQPELFDLIHEGNLKLDEIPELQEIVVGKAPGRTNDKEVFLFNNNTGTGIQFIAAGVKVYENAKKKGMGREIPTDWFMTDLSAWIAKGFSPSP